MILLFRIPARKVTISRVETSLRHRLLGYPVIADYPEYLYYCSYNFILSRKAYIFVWCK